MSPLLYKLAEGTLDERDVPLDPGRQLSEAADAVFPKLAAIHAAASQKTHGHPLETQQGVFVEAFFMLWCYAAHDIKRLSQRCSRLETDLASARAAIEEIATGCQVLESVTKEATVAVEETVSAMESVAARVSEAHDVRATEPEHNDSAESDAEKPIDLSSYGDVAVSVDAINMLLAQQALVMVRDCLDFASPTFCDTSDEVHTDRVLHHVEKMGQLSRDLKKLVEVESYTRAQVRTLDNDDVPF